MPSRPFRIREIAVQAGLSEATVDRVLNGRSGVRDSTLIALKLLDPHQREITSITPPQPQRPDSI